jgi:hypothetical protein
MDLENTIAEAEALSDFGKLEEAEHKFLEALAGFENLLSPCNEKTVSLAYQIAEFYAKHVRMREADDILERVSKSLIKTWGLEHSKTVAHMLHVTNLYYAWSRPNDALTLLLRAVEYLDDPPMTKDVQVQPENRETQPTALRRATIVTRLVTASEPTGPKDRPRLVEFQLVVANAQARAKDEEAESILLDLIKQCERFPGQFAVQNFKAHGSLLHLYSELQMLGKLRPALKNAKDCFLATMKKEKRKQKQIPISLLNAAIDLAEHFVKAGRFKDSETMFDLVEEEVTATIDEEGPDNAIDFLVAIGSVYQTHRKWKYAKPRFEHAYAITLATRGPECRMAKRLQAALDDQFFSMASLPHTGYRRPLRKLVAEQ